MLSYTILRWFFKHWKPTYSWSHRFQPRIYFGMPYVTWPTWGIIFNDYWMCFWYKNLWVYYEYLIIPVKDMEIITIMRTILEFFPIIWLWICLWYNIYEFFTVSSHYYFEYLRNNGPQIYVLDDSLHFLTFPILTLGGVCS